MNWIECKFLYEMRKKISSLFYHLECDHRIWSENKFIYKFFHKLINTGLVEFNKRSCSRTLIFWKNRTFNCSNLFKSLFSSFKSIFTYYLEILMENKRESDSFIMDFYQMRIFLNIDIWSQFSQEDALIQYYLVENPTRISNILWDEDQSFLELLSYFSETSKRFSEVIYFSAVKIMCGQLFYFLLCKLSVIQFSRIDTLRHWSCVV